MRYLRINSKGYTLIEVVLVLALIGIILAPVSSFFISNLKTYNRADDQVELQYQAQIAMNEFINKVIRTKGIINVVSTGNAVSKVTFDNSAIGSVSQQIVVIEHKENGLFFGYGSTATVVFANYISKLTLTPIPSGSYQNSRGIIVTIEVERKDSSLSVTNEVYFRN